MLELGKRKMFNTYKLYATRGRQVAASHITENNLSRMIKERLKKNSLVTFPI